MSTNRPIRVLHEVAGLGKGGVETFLMNVYKNIDRSEVQFDFILSHDWNNHSYDSVINEMGGKVFYLQEGAGQFYSFYRFLKNHKEYDIVHSHRGAFGSFYLFVAWLAGIKFRISHSHTSSAKRWSKAFGVVLLRPFLRLVSTHRFSCGKSAGEWMFGKKAEFEVLNNSIDVASFRHFENRARIRDSYGIDHNDLVFGHVGRFAKEKNHSFLIDVFDAIHKLRNNTKLILIGDGDLRKGIEDKVKTLGLTDSVWFLLEREDVNDLLLAIDFIIFPSFYEGFSFAMLEMQAASLRILASDSIPKEINVTGEVYFKSLQNKTEDWAEEALMLSQYDRLSISADRIYSKGYDIEYNAKKLETFYRSLIPSTVIR